VIGEGTDKVTDRIGDPADFFDWFARSTVHRCL
jgi:hypothetical protein